MEDRYQKISKLLKELGIIHYRKNYHNLEELGLYPGQPAIIKMIEENEGINQKDLANLVFKKTSTVNIMLDRLSKADIVIKRENDKDKRSTNLFLTTKGKDLGIKLKKLRQDMMDSYFTNISSDELDTFILIFEKIKNNIEKEE